MYKRQVLSGAALTLTACGNNNNNNASDKKVSFKEAVPKKQVKKGGTLKYAIESDSPFTGIFLPELSDTSTDTEIQSPGLESLFSVDDSYKINNKGAACLLYTSAGKLRIFFLRSIRLAKKSLL